MPDSPRIDALDRAIIGELKRDGLTILLAGFTAVFGMLFLNGLPRPYHPVFNVPRFGLASREKFFLLVEAADPKYDYDETKAFLGELKPQEVFDVEE